MASTKKSDNEQDKEKKKKKTSKEAKEISKSSKQEKVKKKKKTKKKMNDNNTANGTKSESSDDIVVIPSSSCDSQAAEDETEEKEIEKRSEQKSRSSKNSNKKSNKRKLKAEDDNEEGEDGTMYKFPMARIKRIIKSEDRSLQLSQDVVFLVNKATEKFIEQFCEDAYNCSVRDRKKSLGYKHSSSVVSEQRRFDFLSDFVPEKLEAVAALAQRKSLETRQRIEPG